MLWTFQNQKHHLLPASTLKLPLTEELVSGLCCVPQGVPPSKPALSAGRIDHLSVNNCALPAIHPRFTLLEHQLVNPCCHQIGWWTQWLKCLMMTGRHGEKVSCSDGLFPSTDSVHGNGNCFLVLCAATSVQRAEPHLSGEECWKSIQQIKNYLS